jgi:hypothetical protein
LHEELKEEQSRPITRAGKSKNNPLITLSFLRISDIQHLYIGYRIAYIGGNLLSNLPVQQKENFDQHVRSLNTPRSTRGEEKNIENKAHY